ncbi:hypothetical protein, partial [Escherichia coli]
FSGSLVSRISGAVHKALQRIALRVITMDLSPEDAKFLRELQHRMLREAIIEQQTGMSAIDPLRYKRASSPLVDDNSNADKTRPPH